MSQRKGQVLKESNSENSSVRKLAAKVIPTSSTLKTTTRKVGAHSGIPFLLAKKKPTLLQGVSSGTRSKKKMENELKAENETCNEENLSLGVGSIVLPVGCQPLSTVMDGKPLSAAKNDRPPRTTKKEQALSSATDDRPLRTTKVKQTLDAAKDNPTLKTTKGKPLSTTKDDRPLKTTKGKKASSATKDDFPLTAKDDHPLSTTKDDRPLSAAMNVQSLRSVKVDHALSVTKGVRPLRFPKGTQPLSATKGTQPLRATKSAQPLSAVKGAQPDTATKIARPFSAAKGARPDTATKSSRSFVPTKGTAQLSATKSTQPLSTAEDDSAISTTEKIRTISTFKTVAPPKAATNTQEPSVSKVSQQTRVAIVQPFCTSNKFSNISSLETSNVSYGRRLSLTQVTSNMLKKKYGLCGNKRQSWNFEPSNDNCSTPIRGYAGDKQEETDTSENFQH